MEKVLIIDNKEVTIKANGYTPVLYKATFKKDLFNNLLSALGGYNRIAQMQHIADEEEIGLELIEELDLTFFYQLLWTNAKSADSSIPPMEEWLSSFDSLPILNHLEDLIEINFANLEGSNKKK